MTKNIKTKTLHKIFEEWSKKLVTYFSSCPDTVLYWLIADAPVYMKASLLSFLFFSFPFVFKKTICILRIEQFPEPIFDFTG